MMNNQGDAGKKPGGPGVGAGRETSPGRGHSITAAFPPPAALPADDLLERVFVELVRYYRHSSVGRRCRGIVHQMNTPLQILSFQLDLMEQKTRQEEEILAEFSPAGAGKLMTLHHYRREKLRQWRTELGRLQNFSQILALQGVHEDIQERFPLDLNQVYRQELELYLAQPFFKHRVTREFTFGGGLPLIFGHYIDFSQSFRNFIDNALEAMDGVENPHLTIVTTYEDRKIRLRIGDTGVGIPPPDLPRIFEPFFTTKRTVNRDRVGLGLFMAGRLLAPYGAEIRVDSTPGGTWVTVSIPGP